VERLSAVRVAGVVLGFVAAGLVTLDSVAADVGAVDPLWCLLALVIPLLYATYTVFVAARWPTGLDAVQVAQGQAIAVSIAVLAALPFQPSLASVPLGGGEISAIAGVVLCEILGLMLYLRLARDRGPTFVTMANYVAICVGAAVSFAAFGDPIGWLTVLGALLLVAALQLARVRPVTASSG
jgi:drug/metabolite transporter (DMT)-like permease